MNKLLFDGMSPLERTPQSRPSYQPQRRQKLDFSDALTFFEANVVSWSQLPRLHARLESFGLPPKEIKPFLSAFVSAVRSGSLSTPDAIHEYTLSRFAHAASDVNSSSQTDIVFTTTFLQWASNPAHQSLIRSAGVPMEAIATIRRLTQAAERVYPAEEHPAARKMHRKVIMHVGPTNSGKTHHALRALAASNVGVYAGPLRLLAHEIWERLNLGEIVPLGMEEAPQKSTRLPRRCNMLTGEEQKIVSEDAPLLSCTVEMLSLNRKYDVAVVDEIQMIADDQRGSGWTYAVLGLCARELHLCGEETAVPLVQALLKDTGDELIINRYERLTPLLVEEESLDGDWGLIRKGDCIVTFSRSNIFAIKRQVEEKTGMRCAVVYGRLPPEIRSEQAALFNDPGSGYDVIIGSDAIGMGLNLKIRRIIFEALKKWDGGSERSLSISQIKQIAGRAGRYGLHGDSKPGGFTTTLNASDLPTLRHTLGLPAPNLPFARLGPTTDTFTKIAHALPPGASTETVYVAHTYAARLQDTFRFADHPQLSTMCAFIDKRGGVEMTVTDRVLYSMAPIPWRDRMCLDVVARFMHMHREEMCVDLIKGLEGTRFIDTMTRIETMMRAGKEPGKAKVQADALGVLEAFHKLVVLYVWMSFRNSVVWNQGQEVEALKGRLERVLEWCLKALSKEGTALRAVQAQIPAIVPV
ncbi:P-loop containing nucleoside triphosphate hydrolase protein [Infundibulicybe gibba]|nr:P-loop containing nucleoside triphosphate hydrolase protein [Infundibulicybe gibba]